jgi:hypothetical protein
VHLQRITQWREVHRTASTLKKNGQQSYEFQEPQEQENNGKMELDPWRMGEVKCQWDDSIDNLAVLQNYDRLSLHSLGVSHRDVRLYSVYGW